MASGKFTGLSRVQRERFKAMAGYPYEGDAHEGSFSTDRPHNEPWDLSPFWFSYQFHPETGHLFCELDHRMTNNRIAGWDQDGNELARELVEAVFPSHW